MAPVPISGEHLLYDTIDRAINADKGLTLKDTTSGWGCEQPYYNWSPPEPRLFEDASTREPSQWEKFIESLLVADSWFDWSSNEDTSIRVGSLAEFEGTGDGVVGDIPNLSISRDEWWDLPRDSGPKIPMPLGYQKSSSSVMTGRLEAPINTTTAQGVPRIPTRPKSSTYTTHDFGIWPPEMTVSPTQYDKDWFLTKRGVPPAAADFGLPLGTCDATWQQATLVGAVGGVAVVILGLKIWKIRAGQKVLC